MEKILEIVVRTNRRMLRLWVFLTPLLIPLYAIFFILFNSLGAPITLILIIFILPLILCIWSVIHCYFEYKTPERSKLYKKIISEIGRIEAFDSEIFSPHTREYYNDKTNTTAWATPLWLIIVSGHNIIVNRKTNVKSAKILYTEFGSGFSDSRVRKQWLLVLDLVDGRKSFINVGRGNDDIVLFIEQVIVD